MPRTAEINPDASSGTLHRDRGFARSDPTQRELRPRNQPDPDQQDGPKDHAIYWEQQYEATVAKHAVSRFRVP